MLWTVLIVGLYIFFLHKHATNYSESIFLLFTTGAYTFCGAAIKQTAAMGLCMLAVHFYMKRKKMVYVICILIATTIHPYALMYFLVPFFLYRPWTTKTYVIIIAFVAVGLALQPMMGTVINITTMLGEEYTVEELSGAGVNIFRVLVCNVPLLLSFFYQKQLFADSTEEENLFVNLSMLNGAIMFVGLFGTANYFARLANYFIVFQCMALPWMIEKIHGRDHDYLKVAMVVCYLAYFYYANVINLPFDESFSRYTLNEYLSLPR